MQAALKAFETWKYSSVEERTNLLFRVGHLLRERKFELMAWLVFEVGKNWAEADGDVAETDRLLPISMRSKRCGWPRPRRRCSCRASATELRYIPLGVGAVIPPWNFPGARSWAA